MIPAKPIVPGCICIIIGGQFYRNSFITAIMQMPPGTFDMNGHDVSGHWLTDLPPLNNVKRWVVRPEFLMRVDDPDNTKQFIVERNLENIKPKVTKCPTQPPSVESSQ